MRHVMVSSVCIKECVRRKQVTWVKVSFEMTLADLSTGCLPKNRLEQLRRQAAVIDSEGEARPKPCQLANQAALHYIECLRIEAAKVAFVASVDGYGQVGSAWTEETKNSCSTVRSWTSFETISVQLSRSRLGSARA